MWTGPHPGPRDTRLIEGAAEFAPNAAPYLERRRRDAAERWDLRDEVVLIGAGSPLPIPGRGDRTYPYRSHSEYFYLTDRERPDGVLAFDPLEGWMDFVVPASRDEALWQGASLEAVVGTPISGLEAWLAIRRGRRIAWLGVAPPNARQDDRLTEDLRYALNDVRRHKDDLELGRMRVAEAATRAGFSKAERLISPGRSERQIQIELEAAFFLYGADSLAFDTIVAGGPNSAVLHFTPTERRLQANDLVLIDAGGEFRGYASDITRTYPASGQFSAEQANLYRTVQKASMTAILMCRPGREWRDVHRAATTVIAEGLVDFGLLRGNIGSLVERGSPGLFFPHGVGHLVGLGIRDASEILRGREQRPDDFPRLRLDLPLLPNYVVTVEPGIYFVPALLNDGQMRRRHRDAVDWDMCERMLGFGGIRLEDNVLITETGFEVLTDDVPYAV